jgi:hypothetical protein
LPVAAPNNHLVFAAMKAFKWAFLGIATAIFVFGMVVLPFLWLETERVIPHAIDLFFVMNTAMTLFLPFASFLFLFVFMYVFARLPEERRAPALKSSLPIVIGIALILMTGVPVKGHDACGNKHSIAPLLIAPVFWSNPNTDAQAATYDLDEVFREDCG